ncbi:MAG: hypothetical protein ACRDSH_09705 [Pseudonocardiaceae bacterium]
MNEVEILAVCEVHDGSGPLVVRREGNRIVLDGHADQCCVFKLDAGAVDRLFDALGKWLFDRASWVFTPEGLGHVPKMQGPGLLVTACYRSLSDWVPYHGPVPEVQRWCPQCLAAFGLPPHLAIPPAETPAGRRLSDAPESTPDDQPAPTPSTPGARTPG